ncbi:YppF family protein [Virgibacillus natechei]|uniref:YppF family protein n=1 Tax=Virgibacillus sp. CBA3643 TaxID=2942278 RepID=UPI0035A3C65B
MWDELNNTYIIEREQSPESTNDLLDFYQGKYVTGKIDIHYYQKVYYYLHEEGAISVHEYA